MGIGPKRAFAHPQSRDGMNRQHGLRVLILSSSPLHRKTITRFDGLTAAGATVVVAGYERDNFKDTTAVRYDHVSLGTAKNRDVIGRLLTLPLMLQRALAAVRRLGGCDIFWTNSLDMLALGTLLRPLVNNKAQIVYDVADLTPRQLSRDFPSRLLRFGERLLCAGIKTLLITSPWFYWRYYREFVPAGTQVMLLENKVSPPAPTIAPSQAAPPWRIVWHGLLRCRGSLETIVEIARQLPDLVDIHA